MQIEIAPDANMAMDGKAILRSLQNNTTPRLDLFVREALQNSLDAAQEGMKPQLDLSVGMLRTSRIAHHFQGIEKVLQSRYQGEMPYLMLRDSGTAGLSGPVRHQDIESERGNLRKLVYEIAKPQEMAGAGGSWGLGKTAYFRMGIGLVLYYSRFRDPQTDRFHSRLAATLIEDQTSPRTLLPHKAGSRGIAWWGQADPKYPGSTIPLTDEEAIAEVLISFGLTPYEAQETGTTVMIPFIDEEALLKETASTPDPGKRPYWHDNLGDYLEIAVQRWYAPRLENSTDFGDHRLGISVNGRRVVPRNASRLIQQLYHAARTGSGEYKRIPIEVREILLNRTFEDSERRAGRLAYVRIPKSAMGSGAPERTETLYAFAGVQTPRDEKNPPLVAYTRKPGMIVSYETSGAWVPNQHTNDTEYVVGVFVSDDSRILEAGHLPLEEYLRTNERADHMGWQDGLVCGQRQTVVSRISKQVRRKLNDSFEAAALPPQESGIDLGLGRALAQVFMPPGNFGGWDRGRGGLAAGGGSGGTGAPPRKPAGSMPSVHRGKNVRLRQTGTRIWDSEGAATIPVRIDFGDHDAACVELRVLNETGSQSAVDWENQTGQRSPVEICSFKVDRILAGDQLIASEADSQQVELTELFTPEGVMYGFRLTDRMAARRLAVEGFLAYRTDHVGGDLIAYEVKA